MAYHRRVVLVRLVGFAAVFATALACNGKNGAKEATYGAQTALGELNFDHDSITAQDSIDLDHTINSGALATSWHNAPCDSCHDSTEVQIRAIAKTTDIKAASGPAHRRILAAIRNRGTEDVYHDSSHVVFKASGIYLLYVQRGAPPDTTTVWGITRLAIGHIKPPIGHLVECEHATRADRVDDANFFNCGDAHATASRISFVKTAYAAPRRTLPPAASIPKRGWISCDPDCCTGGGTYVGPAF